MTNTDLMPPAIVPTRNAQGLHERLRATVYIAGATSLMTFCKALGVTAFYISASGRREHMHRIENRRDIQHGSILANPAQKETTAIQLDLGEEHFLSPIDAEVAAKILLTDGIRFVDGVIEVDLAPGDTTTGFEKRLARGLKSRMLNNWLGTPQGQSSMSEAGYDPKLRLHTAYRYIGPEPRISLVTEAFLFRPRRELQDLINVIEIVRTRD